MKNKQVKQMWTSIFTYHEIDVDTVEVEWSKHFQPCYEEVDALQRNNG